MGVSPPATAPGMDTVLSQLVPAQSPPWIGNHSLCDPSVCQESSKPFGIVRGKRRGRVSRVDVGMSHKLTPWRGHLIIFEAPSGVNYLGVFTPPKWADATGQPPPPAPSVAPGGLQNSGFTTPAPDSSSSGCGVWKGMI